ncbi:hypothetical protein PINS_up004819 [Pythium insidiosum]|nr:hypothetical protein PINS_up004819 [Pythium insidiosum]
MGDQRSSDHLHKTLEDEVKIFKEDVGHGDSGIKNRARVRFEDVPSRLSTTDSSRSTQGSSEDGVKTVPYHRVEGMARPIVSTYQANFQWPRRDDLLRVMEKVGGKTAGGPPRYVRQGVYDASAAMNVAEESAREFLRDDAWGQDAGKNPQEPKSYDETKARPTDDNSKATVATDLVEDSETAIALDQSEFRFRPT